MPTDLPASKQGKLIKKFRKFSDSMDKIVGSPYWFVFSVILVLIWVPSGFIVGWGDTWQLIINTTTTILTFLMMSLLHASENKWEERMDKFQEKELKAIRESAEISAQKTREILHQEAHKIKQDEQKEAVNSLR